MTPRVLFPAPGLPALLGPGEDAFTLELAVPEPARDAVEGWARRLSLRQAPSARPVALSIESVEIGERDVVGPLAEEAVRATPTPACC